MKKIIILSVFASILFAMNPRKAAAAVDCSGVSITSLSYLQCLTNKANEMYRQIFSAMQETISTRITANKLAEAAQLRLKYAAGDDGATAEKVYEAMNAFMEARNALQTFLMGNIKTDSTERLNGLVSTAASKSASATSAASEENINQEIKSFASYISAEINKIQPVAGLISDAMKSYNEASELLSQGNSADIEVLLNTYNRANASVIIAIASIERAEGAIERADMQSPGIHNLSEDLRNRFSGLSTKVTNMQDASLLSNNAASLADSIKNLVNVGAAVGVAIRVANLLDNSGKQEEARIIQNGVEGIPVKINEIARAVESAQSNMSSISPITNIPENGDNVVKTTLTGINLQIEKLNMLIKDANDAGAELVKLNSEFLQAKTKSTLSDLEIAYSTLMNLQGNAGRAAARVSDTATNRVGVTLGKNGYQDKLKEIDIAIIGNKIEDVRNNQTALQANQQIERLLEDLKSLADAVLTYAGQSDFKGTAAANDNLAIVESGLDSVKEKYRAIVVALGGEAAAMGSSQGQKAKRELERAEKYHAFANAAISALRSHEALNLALNNASASTMVNFLTQLTWAKSELEKIKQAATETVTNGNRGIITGRIAIKLENAINEAENNKYIKIITLTSNGDQKINDIRQILGGDNFSHSWQNQRFSNGECGEICQFKAYAGWKFCGSCAHLPTQIDKKDTTCTDGSGTSVEINGMRHDYSEHKCMIELN